MHLPEAQRKRGFSAAPEFVRNVMGSSAGAGSGEFHVYRHIRRRENARLKYIAEEAAKVSDTGTGRRAARSGAVLRVAARLAWEDRSEKTTNTEDLGRIPNSGVCGVLQLVR